MNWVERKTITYSIDELPKNADGKLRLHDPSAIKVYVPGYRYPVDVGSWCYTIRKRISSDSASEACASYFVDLSSIRPKRKKFICAYLEYLMSHISFGKSPKSLKTSVGQFQAFVDWCSRHIEEAMDSKEDYVEAVRLFTEEKISQIRSSQININTAATLQLILIKTGRYIYDDTYGDLFRHIRKISRSQNSVNRTVVPEDELARNALRVYLQVFEQLSNFVVSFESFPKNIVVGEEDFWFFPTAIPFAGPSTIESKEALKHAYVAYDFVEGRIRSVSEISKMSKSEYHSVHCWSHRNATRNVADGNGNYFHKRRIDAATFAVQAFAMIFSANTGMNLGQIVDLPWNDEFEVVRDKIGFKGIKYRAGSREVVFHIASGFYSKYLTYLKLRSYLLEAFNIAEYPYLFFTTASGSLVQLGMNLSTHFHERLKNCFGIDEKVTTRMWRAFKSDWLIRNTDVTTAATLLQNSPITVVRHYAEGSQKRNESEIKMFFDTYKDLVVDQSKKSEATPVGQCVNKNPIPIENSPIEPSCSSFEGCLFCENYKVHPDSIDFHKLISFRYLLESSQVLAYNIEHFEVKMAPVIGRLNNVLELIESNFEGDPKELERIEYEVLNNENLYEYWKTKLRALIYMGVLE